MKLYSHLNCGRWTTDYCVKRFAIKRSMRANAIAWTTITTLDAFHPSESRETVEITFAIATANSLDHHNRSHRLIEQYIRSHMFDPLTQYAGASFMCIIASLHTHLALAHIGVLMINETNNKCVVFHFDTIARDTHTKCVFGNTLSIANVNTPTTTKVSLYRTASTCLLLQYRSRCSTFVQSLPIAIAVLCTLVALITANIFEC